MKKIYLILIALLGLHLFLLANLRFTAWPEMLSYPYLRNHGYLLYKDMIHPYPPILTIALSIIYKLFGYKLIVLKLFTWLTVLTNDILIFLVVRKLTGRSLLAVVGLLFYVLIQSFLEGNMLWFDLAIVPSILLATYCLLHKKYFWSGVFFGIAALTKQTAALFLILTSLFIILKNKNLKSLYYFLIGPVILVLALVVRLLTEGAVGGFLNWTLIYPFRYWSHFPGYVQMALTGRQWLVMILLSLPAIFLAIQKKYLLVISYYLLALILVYPRFSFFHFQLGIALAAVLSVLALAKVKSRFLISGLVAGYLVLAIVLAGQVIKRDWGKEARFWGSEDITAAGIIRNTTWPDEPVLMLGPHSGLYILADRLPPKPWVDNYVWYLEVPGVQEEIISRWTQNKPAAVFTRAVEPGNWYDLGTYRPQKIVEWLKEEKINEISLY